MSIVAPGFHAAGSSQQSKEGHPFPKAACAVALECSDDEDEDENEDENEDDNEDDNEDED